MTFIQLIIVACAVLALFRVWARFRGGELSVIRAALWAGVWLAMAGVTLLPQVASWLAARVGVGRGADAVVYLSIVLLFWLSFRLLVRQDQQERELTKLVRQLALKDLPNVSVVAPHEHD